MRQNISRVFSETSPQGFTAIILAAGEAESIKMFGSNRSLVVFNSTTLIGHQIVTLRRTFPNLADIIVVLGYDHERTLKSIPSGIRVVINERWADTSETHSLDLALKATTTNSVIIISGDMYFESSSLMLPTKTTLSVAPMKPEKVGLSILEGKVSHLSYGLPDKWAQISYVVDGVAALKKHIDNDRSLLFEVINSMIGGGIEFNYARVNNVKEINTYKDAEGLV